MSLKKKKLNKTLNKPFRLPFGSKKKFGVYVKNDKSNTVMVKFGDPNMTIKRNDPDLLILDLSLASVEIVDE